MNQKELVIKIQSGIVRFLDEMQPYWEKHNVEKLINPCSLEDEIVEKALKELQAEGVIYIVKDEEVYFLISEKFVDKVLGNKSSIGDFQIKKIQKLKEKFNIP